jgi:hypothetical protein
MNRRAVIALAGGAAASSAFRPVAAHASIDVAVRHLEEAEGF